MAPRRPADHRRAWPSPLPPSSERLLIWYVPVTHSDSHLLQSRPDRAGPGPRHPARTGRPGGSLIVRLPPGQHGNADPGAAIPVRHLAYYHLATRTSCRFSRQRASSAVQPAAIRPCRNLPVKWRPGYDALSFGLLLIEQLANLLAAGGRASCMVLRRRNTVIAPADRTARPSRQPCSSRSCGSAATLAVAYGQERRPSCRGWRCWLLPCAGCDRSFAGMACQARQARLAASDHVRAWQSSWSIPATWPVRYYGGGTSANLARQRRSLRVLLQHDA